MLPVARLALRGIASLSVVALTLSGAATAASAVEPGPHLGSLTFSPATGLDVTAVTATTSGVCPATATNLQISILGSGFPASLNQLVLNNSPIATYPTDPSTGGYDVAFLDTLRDFADQQSPPVVLDGVYDFTLMCRTNTGLADLGDFTGSLTFTDPTHYTSGAPTPVATTTTLTATPSATAVAGGTVTLAAAVTPAGATGSVQFLDGATALGTAAVSGTSATITTTTLALGSHALTAVFTPTAPVGATPSTSPALSYTVTAPAAPAVAPAVSHPSAFVLTVGTKLTCPGGSRLAVPAAEIGKAIACNAGGPHVLVAEGARPIALVAPSLTGTGKVGSKLVLKPGIWTPAYSSRTVVWKRDGKVIAKQSGGFYVVKATDKGHKISATVTAHLAGHPDGTASTAPVKTKALSASLLSSTTAVLDGVAGDSTPLGVPVGSVIGCVKGDFAGATTTTSGWLVDGKAYDAPVAFLVPDALVGHQLVCRTTGTGPGGTTVSDAVANIGEGAALLPYIAPKIAGTAKVGKKLTASAGKWFPVYAKATFVWLRNGVPIKGATKATYVLGKADKKHKISVRVTATRTGWGTSKAASAAVSVG